MTCPAFALSRISRVAETSMARRNSVLSRSRLGKVAIFSPSATWIAIRSMVTAIAMLREMSRSSRNAGSGTIIIPTLTAISVVTARLEYLDRRARESPETNQSNIRPAVGGVRFVMMRDNFQVGRLGQVQFACSRHAPRPQAARLCRAISFPTGPERSRIATTSAIQLSKLAYFCLSTR